MTSHSNVKHTRYDLAQMQSLPLEAKIRMSKQRIEQWYDHWDGQVYVSFSGGKDSTVLLHLVRSMYPEVEAVFVDTGLEYPKIREFVKTFDNVIWVKPEMNFKEVIKVYGYPVASKEISNTVYWGKKPNDSAFKSTRLMRLNGELLTPDGKKSPYNCKKWHDLLDAPFKVSDECCSIMKKKPLHKYEKETGRKPFVGQLSCESRKREQAWMHTGCNAFEKKKPQSNPMAFWTENDVLEYIVKYNVPICSVYGDIVPTGGIIERGFEQIEELHTTGLKRTGCMFCMFGLHLEAEPNRFQQMKKTHPKTWEYCMKPVDEGGLGISGVIDYMNEHCNCHIEKE